MGDIYAPVAFDKHFGIEIWEDQALVFGGAMQISIAVALVHSHFWESGVENNGHQFIALFQC